MEMLPGSASSAARVWGEWLGLSLGIPKLCPELWWWQIVSPIHLSNHHLKTPKLTANRDFYFKTQVNPRYISNVVPIKTMYLEDNNSSQNLIFLYRRKMFPKINVKSVQRKLITLITFVRIWTGKVWICFKSGSHYVAPVSLEHICSLELITLLLHMTKVSHHYRFN